MYAQRTLPSSEEPGSAHFTIDMRRVDFQHPLPSLESYILYKLGNNRAGCSMAVRFAIYQQIRLEIIKSLMPVA